MHIAKFVFSVFFLNFFYIKISDKFSSSLNIRRWGAILTPFKVHIAQFVFSGIRAVAIGAMAIGTVTSVAVAIGAVVMGKIVEKFSNLLGRKPFL